jgi:hypothetical protein
VENIYNYTQHQVQEPVYSSNNKTVSVSLQWLIEVDMKTKTATLVKKEWSLFLIVLIVSVASCPQMLFPWFYFPLFKHPAFYLLLFQLYSSLYNQMPREVQNELVTKTMRQSRRKPITSCSVTWTEVQEEKWKEIRIDLVEWFRISLSMKEVDSTVVSLSLSLSLFLWCNDERCEMRENEGRKSRRIRRGSKSFLEKISFFTLLLDSIPWTRLSVKIA